MQLYIDYALAYDLLKEDADEPEPYCVCDADSLFGMSISCFATEDEALEFIINNE